MLTHLLSFLHLSLMNSIMLFLGYVLLWLAEWILKLVTEKHSRVVLLTQCPLVIFSCFSIVLECQDKLWSWLKKFLWRLCQTGAYLIRNELNFFSFDVKWLHVVMVHLQNDKEVRLLGHFMMAISEVFCRCLFCFFNGFWPGDLFTL